MTTLSLAACLTPGVALFCLQWNRSDRTAPAAGDPAEVAALEPQSSLAGSFVAASLAARYDLANPGQRAADPFTTAPTPEMVGARGDPYMLLFLSGESGGDTQVVSRSQHVVTLGPPLPRARPWSRDADLLRTLDTGLGGSFGHFFARILARPDAGLTAEDLAVEENPFARAASEPAQAAVQPEAPKGAAAPESAPGAHASEPTARQAPPPAPTKAPPPPPVATGPGPTATVRPNLLLRVAGGTLDAVAMSQPREGVFESAQAGGRVFDSLTFADVPDTGFGLGAADFNKDGLPDVALYVPQQGLLRFYFGTSAGEFVEETRMVAGRDPGSLALGDFDGDGAPDVALSQVGTGLLTIFYGDGRKGFPRFRIFWLDTYRDYISAFDGSGDGVPEVVGITYANGGTVLLDFSRADASGSARKLDVTPALEAKVSISGGRAARLSATLLGGALSVNLDNSAGALVHALNVAAGLDAYVVVGDLSATGHLAVGIATPKK